LYVGGIITNPDFDEGLRGWSAMGDCSLQLRQDDECCGEERANHRNFFLVATDRTASYNGPSQMLPSLTTGVRYMVSGSFPPNSHAEFLACFKFSNSPLSAFLSRGKKDSESSFYPKPQTNVGLFVFFAMH
jgi:hypothetical protein